MTFQCEGTSYCDQGDTAVVVVTIDGNQQTLNFSGTPICVAQYGTNPSGTQSCWHLWLTNNDTGNPTTDIYYERFFCAADAQIVDISQVGYPGYYTVQTGEELWVNLNGYVPENFKFQIGEYGGILYGANLEQSDNQIALSANGAQGGCGGTCLSTCQIKIFDLNGNQLFQNGGQQCSYQVSCSGCPPGYLKCTSTDYPGYCCLPCEEIEKQLQSAIDLTTSMKLQLVTNQNSTTT